jgi:hypothetical protein
MTLVISTVEAHSVIMGADSASGSPEESYVCSHLAKIALCGPYLVGWCGAARVGQILHHCVQWPEPADSDDLLPFLVQEVAPEIRRAVKGAGAEYPGRGFLGEKTAVLVGIRGQLYSFGCDLAVVRWDGPICIGCGRHAAYPVLEALKLAGIEPARKRIEMTLDIVARHAPVVEPPFRFLELSSTASQG